jgi:hypothetical protein
VTGKLPLPPDLMLRFTPTPYVFELGAGRDLIRIETDDLQVALSLRCACKVWGVENVKPIVFFRLVRDRRAPQYGEELSVFSSGRLKTLLHATGTLLVADIERREVFGLIGAGLSLAQLTEKLLPLLAHIDAAPLAGAFYKQVTNGTLRSDNLTGCNS